MNVRPPDLTPSTPGQPHRGDSLSALPSPLARAAAFAAIIAGGIAGAIIGYSLVRIQCDGDCGVALGFGILIGALTAAAGMSVVAILVLRAVGEWRELQARDGGTIRSRR